MTARTASQPERMNSDWFEPVVVRAVITGSITNRNGTRAAPDSSVMPEMTVKVMNVSDRKNVKLPETTLRFM